MGSFGWQNFSEKQKRVLCWWVPGGVDARFEAIVCDGAVRSGKTYALGLSFFLWSFTQFRDTSFGICGKTQRSVKRNLVEPLLPVLRSLGFSCRMQAAQNCLIVRQGKRENRYYLFGGRDAGSASLIQGMTLGGVLLDEVALMPRGFVEQAVARCSVPGARLWFSCNPEGPEHWFYREWILQAESKRALRIHFTMEDNPGLTQATRARYHRLFTGVFYQRFVLGEWVATEGLIYDFLTPEFCSLPPEGEPCDRWVLSCDYGTRNPASFGLWGRFGGVWYRVDEMYYDARAAGRQKTDAEYVEDLVCFVGTRGVWCVVVDPSALSFMEALRVKGFTVLPARNEVLTGIRVTGQLLKERKMVIGPGCGHTLREARLYRWAEGALDAPRKENDHAMDEMRYFAMTVVAREVGGSGRGGVARSVTRF